MTCDSTRPSLWALVTQVQSIKFMTWLRLGLGLNLVLLASSTIVEFALSTFSVIIKSSSYTFILVVPLNTSSQILASAIYPFTFDSKNSENSSAKSSSFISFPFRCMILIKNVIIQPWWLGSLARQRWTKSRLGKTIYMVVDTPTFFGEWR